MNVNPRSITEAERPYIERGLTLDDQADLVERIVSLGYRYDVALAVAAWLGLKVSGATDRTGPSTRSRYRRILQEVRDAAAKVGGAIPGYLKAADDPAEKVA